MWKPEIPGEKRHRMEQALRKNVYHNAQLMLKNYQDIVWALECLSEPFSCAKSSSEIV